MSTDNVTYNFVINYKQKYYDYEENYESYTEDQISLEDRLNGLISGPSLPDSEKLSGFKTSHFEGDSSGIVRNLKIKQGIEIRTVDEATHRTLPFITIGDDIKSGYSFLYRQEMNHALNINSTGYSETLIKNDNGLVKFSDLADYDPIFHISNPQKSISQKEIESYMHTDTIRFRLPTSIESSIISIFGTKSLLSDMDKNKKLGTFRYIDRNYSRGINASFAGGEDRDIGLSLGEKPLKKKRGSCFVDDFIHIEEINRFNIGNLGDVPAGLNFDDARHSKNINPGSTLPEDTYQSSEVGEIEEFDDIKDSLSFNPRTFGMDADMLAVSNAIRSSLRSSSTLGSRHISMTCGFVYENTTLGNTTLGTDSIAFGGLISRY